jgi:DNA-binding NtrC family response regulator
MQIESLKQKGILIVDDEKGVLESLNIVLKGAGFKNISTANDGIQCLSLLDQLGESIYVVVLDLKMPKMGGADVIKHLINVHKPIIGIVVLTGYKECLSVEAFKAMGTENVITANYFLKPFDVKQLIQEIENTIALVHDKRSHQNVLLSNQIITRLNAIEIRLNTLAGSIDQLRNKIPGLTSQLGYDVLRVILIGLFVFALLYFGIGDFIGSIIKKLK